VPCRAESYKLSLTDGKNFTRLGGILLSNYVIIKGSNRIIYRSIYLMSVCVILNVGVYVCVHFLNETVRVYWAKR